MGVFFTLSPSLCWLLVAVYAFTPLSSAGRRDNNPSRGGGGGGGGGGEVFGNGRRKATPTALQEDTEKESSSSHYPDVYPAIGGSNSRKKGVKGDALERYRQEHAQSIADPAAFWKEKALDLIDWERPFSNTMHGSLRDGDVSWFTGGKLNVCYNAVDRHVYSGKATKTALLWEGDEPSQVRRISYDSLLKRVSQIANALLEQGVKKGDVVTIYMPMIPELSLCMLACARIGAVHSVIFAGFSAEAVAARVVAANSKTIITANRGKRGGKDIQLLDIVQSAVQLNKADDVVDKILVWDHALCGTYNNADETTKSSKKDDDEPTVVESSMNDGKVQLINMNALVNRQRPYCPPATMDSEDSLFILYTSGSTGMPKGLVHTTGGYALYAAFTTKTTFDLKNSDDEVFACVADCGWITGHSYIIYGPLLNGCTTFLFESTPVYPDAGRYWDMVDRHRITHFYTAPTAIRLLMRYGNEIPAKYDLSSLKVLGSVGEPINPAAWRWYYEHVGREKCTVVDTYWQTETGGHVATNIPGITPMQPGSCTLPLYGIDLAVLDPVTGKEISPKDPPTENDEDPQSQTGVLAIRQPWPGMARTCLGDHERFQTVYLKPYPGYYFTGDSVLRQRKTGYHYITGRVDDVLNVSGHRIGTAEVESALVLHPAVAQAACVGKSHPVKGEAIVAFCMLQVEYLEKHGNKDDDHAELIKELRNQVRNEIGPFASPDDIYIAPSLPFTRSGKIMRRILRKIVAGETDTLGDTSTLADPSIVDALIEKVEGGGGKK